MRHSKFGLALAVLCLMSLLCVGPALVSAADSASASLDRALQEQAPEILKQLREKGYKNIGVLKFRIKKGTDPVSDKVGTLNMFLADRLEVALILVNSNDSAKQIGIVKKASAVAAKIPGASHVTADGRAKLFSVEYPLAWGDSSVKPDAFLTGIAQVSADLKQITVGVLAFDASGGGVLTKVVPPFNAVTSPSLLGEVGESFTLRGAFDSAKPEIVSEKVTEVAAKVKSSDASHPLADPATPVMLDIQYDGKPVPLEFRNGKAFVAEPQEGQKVMLMLRRTEHAKGRLGVVVKVNGENTLYRQRQRDIDCNKWILELAATPIKLVGYQLDEGSAEAFRVLSDAESSATEMNYGADVGMISLTVFREVGGEPLPEAVPGKTPVPQPETPKPAKKPDPSPTPPSDLPDDAAEDLLALSRGIHPKSPPKNLAALKHQLREAGRTADTRGLIAQGQATVNAVRTVQFKVDPTPILSAAIIYYNPKGAGKPAAN